MDQIVDQIAALPQATRVQILAPVVRARKGEHQKVFDDARRGGDVRVRVDGSIYDLTEVIPLDKNRKHNIEIVVDRVVIRPDQNRRLTDAVEIASALSGGLVLADIPEEKREILFSQNYACDDCGISIEELTPRMFSFNSPYGACPTCGGLGTRLRIDPALIIPDQSKSILDGGITASGWNGVKDESISRMYYDALAEKYHFDLATPIGDLPEHVREILLYGTGDEELTLHYDTNRGAGVLRRPFEGIVCNLERRYQETQSDAMRASLEDCMAETACPDCHGARLRPEVLAVTVSGAQENAVVRCCAYIRDYFRQTIGERAEVLGPAPLPVVRMNNRYRYRVTLYCNQSKAVRRAAANIVMYCNTEKSFRDVTVFADDNPLD